MTDIQPPRGRARRIGGVLLILLGIAALIIMPIGFLFLATLACGMNTTGCQNFEFPWSEAATVLTIPMAIAAVTVWLGIRLRR
jgi:hypothetical protein